MVKIIVKKEKNTRKQKQKQKQTQKVIVNIGKEVITRKRRAPRQSLQKNSVSNKQQQTPTTVYVPQSMPVVMQPQQQSMNELIKYLKESETQKEAVKEKEKNNELETDKKKDEERSRNIIPEEIQENFTRVYNSSNISSLTNSGTATPLLSYPVDPNSLYDELKKVADLRGGNPNSSNLTFATLMTTDMNTPQYYEDISSNSSLSSRSSNNYSLDSYPTSSDNSFISRSSNSNYPISSNSSFDSNASTLDSFQNKPYVDPRFASTRQTGQIAQLWLNKARNNIADYVQNKEPPTQETIITEMKEADKVTPIEVVTAVEDEEITEALKKLPENQIVVYGKQKADASSTATALTNKNTNPIDNTIPSFLRPINKPLPRIYAKDLIRPGTTKEQEEAMRQARINKLDKKPLQIEEEKIDVPKFTEEEMNEYKKYTKQVKEAKQVDEDEDENKIDPIEEKIKDMSIKELGKLLIDNKIKSKDGNDYTISADGKRVYLKGKIQLKQNLSELARQNYKDGKIKKI